MIIIVQPEQP